MSLKVSEARDEILAAALAAVNATSGAGPEEYKDLTNWIQVFSATKDDVPREPDKRWIRFTVRHFASAQATFTGKDGKKRFRRRGILTIQLFGLNRSGQVDTDYAGQVFLDKFEGLETAGGVIFRNVVPNEVGEDGPWFNSNVLGEFEYDEIK